MKRHFQFQYNFVFFLCMYIPLQLIIFFLEILFRDEQSFNFVGSTIAPVLFLLCIATLGKSLFNKVQVEENGIRISSFKKTLIFFQWKDFESLQFTVYLGNIYMKFGVLDSLKHDISNMRPTIDKDGFLYILYRKSLRNEILRDCDETIIINSIKEFKKAIFLFNQKNLS